MNLARVDWQNPINRSSPLANGLVAFWLPAAPGQRGGTRLRDLCGRHHGTLTNMSSSADWVQSGGRDALDFDGTDDYIRAAPPVVAYPFSMGVVWTTRKVSGQQYPLTLSDESLSGSYMGILTNNANVQMYGQNNLGQSVYINASFTASIGQRLAPLSVHASASSHTLYYHGQSDTRTNTVTIPAFNLTSIGARKTTALQQLVDGGIRAAAVWSRAISRNEAMLWDQEERLGFPGLLNRRPRLRYFLAEDAAPSYRPRARASQIIVGGGFA